ncbi:helix-turn-helix domain-containing protein [Candidatus Nomurabacteria bacterium]|nr:helix-turn-helix domain-containing protein [Candidatus Nomurabacteria bacterium]
MNDRKNVSVDKACEIAGVSRRTIYYWMATGKVEFFRAIGGSRRIFVDSLPSKREESPSDGSQASESANP